MYIRHTGQVSMLESPEMFGSLPLDPNNDWTCKQRGGTLMFKILVAEDDRELNSQVCTYSPFSERG